MSMTKDPKQNPENEQQLSDSQESGLLTDGDTAAFSTFFAESPVPQKPMKKKGGMSKGAKGVICGAGVVAILGGTLAVLKLTEQDDPADSSSHVDQSGVVSLWHIADSGDIAAVEVEQPDGADFSVHRVIEKQESTDPTTGQTVVNEVENYYLDGYEDLPTSTVNIRTLATRVASISSADIIQENTPASDLAKYGLDKPRYVLKLRGTINGNAVSRELLFGNMITENDNETQMYGYISDSKQVFIVTKAAVSFLEQDTTAYILPYCVDVSIEDLSKIEINMGTVYDLHETLYLDYANEQYALGDIDIDAYEDENILTLYQNFYRAVANLQFSAMDLDAVPEGEAAVTILYTHLDGSVTSAEFVPKAENDFYLVVNGEYTGLTVRLNRFTGSAGMVFSYEALLKGLKDAK